MNKPIRVFLLITLLLMAWDHPSSAGPLFKRNKDDDARVKVTVQGINGGRLKNVLAYLSIEKQKKDPDLTEALIRRLHKRAPEEIRASLKPFGYYSSSIESELTREGNVWHARYMIEPGEAVRVSRIHVVISGPGSQDPSLLGRVEGFPLKEGDVLEDALYEKGKRSLQEAAARRGYLDAALSLHEVRVDSGSQSAEVHLRLETGPRYAFGDVSMQQDQFHPEFLSRFVKIRKGDPYALSALLDLQKSLGDSDYFDRVQVKAEQETAEDLEVPVQVILEPRKRNKYTAGIGYGTDTGVRGSLGWENRRINGWGHKLNNLLMLSEIKNSFTSHYLIPLKDPATDHLDLSGGWLREDTETSRSETYLLGASHIHARKAWKETVYINYQRERFTVADQEGLSTLLMPGISWTRVRTDDRIFSTRGSRVHLDIRGAHKALVSDASFLQVRTEGKLIRSVGESGRIILRGEAGASLVEEFSELPPSVRFFAGGDQSVRGYAYNSLGPTDGDGEVVGGKHLVAGSVEYEHRLYKKWSGAVFYDIGNAIDDLSDPYKRGAGFGIRWKSPVGQIRVDLASGLSKEGDPWRLHVVIGPDL